MKKAVSRFGGSRYLREESVPNPTQALSAQLFTALRVGERASFIIASLLCIIYVFGQSISLLLSGAALFIISIGYQFIRRSRLK